ncbi:unnamed protein product [Callosobruchus maculatus]|uniref:Uncharacterized protein n=1 Tax=Callosobruchus maculatus TaxID=64391 RepID=A0A653DW85_CALMS|nr:unnamed protein product [Callosobruchus maculatus]
MKSLETLEAMSRITKRAENEDESHGETVNTDANSPHTEPETQDSTEKTSSVASGSQFRHRPTPKSQKPDDQPQY